MSQLWTDLADQMFLVALTWAIIVTGHGLDLGLVLMAWALPRGAFLLLGGVLIDRWDRRRLGIATSLLLAFLVLGLSIGFAMHQLTLPIWLVAAVVLGLLDGIRLPIATALIPLVVPSEHVLMANRWSQVRSWMILIIGPALGGIITALFQVTGAFLVVVGLYLVSGWFLVLLPPLPSPSIKQQHILKDLTEGWQFAWKHPRLRLLLPLFALVHLFILGPIAVGIPLFVNNILHSGASGLGFVSGAYGVGMTLGTLSMGKWPRWFSTSMTGLFTLFALSDCGIAIVGFSTTIWMACAAYFFSGLCIGPAATLYQTLLQTSTPPEYLGRISGIARATSFGLEPISSLITGILSQAISASAILITAGLLATGTDLFGVLRGRSIDIREGQTPSLSAEDAASMLIETDRT